MAHIMNKIKPLQINMAKKWCCWGRNIYKLSVQMVIVTQVFLRFSTIIHLINYNVWFYNIRT